MSLSRRGFVRTLGTGAVAAVGGHILGGGRVIGPWTRDFGEVLAAQGAQPLLLLHNNENPLGPGEKAIAAMRGKLTERGYPAARYSSQAGELAAAIAAKYGCKTENVIVGCGSTQILRTATFAFASASKPLVGGTPSYEECSDVARLIGAPVKAVPGTSTLHHDLDAMAAAARGAGLVFFDNPSNPAATLHPATAVDLVRRAHPQRFTGHRRADRRGLSRLRDRSAPQDADPDGARDAERVRCADVLEGLRDGRPAHRLRDRAGRHDQEDARAARGRSTNVLGVAAALASITDEARLQQERSGTPRRGSSPSTGSRRTATSPPTRSATSSSSTSGVRRRSSATPAANRTSSSAATSRRSRSPTCASRSARWTR